MQKKRICEEKTHCCELISISIQDPRIGIDYDKTFREYGLYTTSDARQVIPYCVFCGKKLPQSLSEKWFAILEKEYGLNDPFKKKCVIPEEFKSDAWWKNRGL